MTEYAITKWFGTFLFNESGIIDAKLFPKDPREISRRLLAIQQGAVLEEEKLIAKGKKPIVDEPRLKSIGNFDPDGMIKYEINSKDYGFGIRLLHEASIEVATMKVKKEMESEEREVGQLVKSMDDLYRISNLLSERLREWRGMEMDGKELASKIIEELGINDEKKATKSLATILLEVYSVMDEIEDRIHEKMMKIAPNVSQLVGSTLGARLISLAGGLRKLAMMPSSTVQLLGAERALFRHLKDGSPSPKHGIIFQHELINRSPREKRGKIARALAAKISIAAKADAFTKGKVAKKLKKELDERMKEINAI